MDKKFQCKNCGKEISEKDFKIFDGLCAECYLFQGYEEEQDYEIFQIIDEDDYEDW